MRKGDLAGPALIGGIAAIAAVLPDFLQNDSPFFSPRAGRWSAFIPIILALITIGILEYLRRSAKIRDKSLFQYSGLPDMVVHIHTPTEPSSARRWALSGLTSWLLCAIGAPIGPEGVAIEWAQAWSLTTRNRSARWFQQRRRTDAACAMSGGIASAFGTPFSAVLIPLELGIGGKTTATVVSALAGLLGTQALRRLFAGKSFDLAGALHTGSTSLSWREWTAILLVSVIVGVTGALLTRFFHLIREGFSNPPWLKAEAAIHKKTYAKLIFCAALLTIAFLLHPEGRALPSQLLQEVLWAQHLPQTSALLFLSIALGLSLVLASFGSAGTLWPTLALGGFLGYGAGNALEQWSVLGISGFSTVTGIIGAAGLWGSVLGIPISGTILAYELTGNLQLVLPTLLGAALSSAIARALRTPSLIMKEVEARGLKLLDGRSSSVLESLTVKDAMVTDFHVIEEKTSVSSLPDTLSYSPYPFVPVIRPGGLYSGLLTLDMLQEAVRAGKSHAGRLSNLLEVKDLLYRTRIKTPTLHADQRLIEAVGLCEKFPCLPVIRDDGTVVGLLFAHNVRLVYDKESARRSLAPVTEETTPVINKS